ncbi:MAG: tRNA (adenosine(37)-N6)-threonylcarbamoyltransferase complex ATPase subunit type 1 TsaE [Parafilimonas sp.]
MNIKYQLDTIHEAAEKLCEASKQNKIWAFHSAMGGGKTTFIHALCEVLQVKDVVTSPTFAIINEYESPVAGIIYHMDWYRIKNEREAVDAGIEDCLSSGNICFIEWPENAAKLLPADALHVFIEVMNAGTRRLYTNNKIPVVK